jgi:hypothetical protein
MPTSTSWERFGCSAPESVHHRTGADATTIISAFWVYGSFLVPVGEVESVVTGHEQVRGFERRSDLKESKGRRTGRRATMDVLPPGKVIDVPCLACHQETGWNHCRVGTPPLLSRLAAARLTPGVFVPETVWIPLVPFEFEEPASWLSKEAASWTTEVARE